MTIPRELAAPHDTEPKYALALPAGVELMDEDDGADAYTAGQWARDRDPRHVMPAAYLEHVERRARRSMAMLVRGVRA